MSFRGPDALDGRLQVDVPLKREAERLIEGKRSGRRRGRLTERRNGGFGAGTQIRQRRRRHGGTPGPQENQEGQDLHLRHRETHP
jgi:hypothetical protein